MLICIIIQLICHLDASNCRFLNEVSGAQTARFFQFQPELLPAREAGPGFCLPPYRDAQTSHKEAKVLTALVLCMLMHSLAVHFHHRQPGLYAIALVVHWVFVSVSCARSSNEVVSPRPLICQMSRFRLPTLGLHVMS